MISRRRLKHKKGVVAEINVVPYIDVMLVLLVIFMVTAPLLQQGVSVDLPKASAKTLSSKEEEPVILSIDKKGNYYLNIADSPEVPVSKEQIPTKVAAYLSLHPDNPVMVKGDKLVDYGQVVSGMVLLQQAGAPSVGLVTEDVQNG